MDNLKQHPATYFLSACWVLVYTAMLIHQGDFSFGGGLDLGKIAGPTAHQFGALTASDVVSGQVWRTVTATFIHLSLLHLVFNLTCLISFGRVLESWYGWGQLLLIYVVIGAAGNGLAVAGRYGMHSGTEVLCAGGSSVMFGFIALIAVVGWRSRTRFGDYVRRQMLGKLLVFGVVMGVIGRNLLDNFGHGGGAIAGAAVGFTHRYLLRGFDRPIGRTLGIISLGVLGVCVAAQARAAKTEIALEHRIQSQQAILRAVQTTIENYGWLARLAELRELTPDPSLAAEAKKNIEKSLETLKNLVGTTIPGGNAERFQTWRALAEAAALRFPARNEVSQFQNLSSSLFIDVAREHSRSVNAMRFGAR